MSLRPLILVGLLMLTGCPRQGTTETSGSSPPDDRPAELGLDVAERRNLRGRIERSLAVARADGASAEVERLVELLAVLASLDRIENSRRAPRDKERDAVAALAAWLDAEARALRTAPLIEADPEQGPWARAVVAFEDGELETALDEGLAALEQLVAAGVDSASLRYRLAEWAVQRGDGELAAELFEGAAAVESSQGWIAEEAPIAATRAGSLSLGTDGAALAEARALIDGGRLVDAWSVLEGLVAGGADADILAEARAALELLRTDAADRALHDLARVEQILEGPGPYDEADRLLREVAQLPDGTWDKAEHLRLQGWLRNRAGALSEAERQALEREQAATLQDARDLVVAGEYRAALAAYTKLEGTALQSAARKEAREASETLVREERERAGGLFVAARKLRDPGEKREALREVQEILTGLVDEFPESAYVERIRTNLSAVEAEIAAI